jgi:hypothetical protein
MPEGEGRHLVEGQGQGQSFSSALVPLKMATWWIKGPFDSFSFFMYKCLGLRLISIFWREL